MMTADVLMYALLAYIAVSPPALLSGPDRTQYKPSMIEESLWKNPDFDIHLECVRLSLFSILIFLDEGSVLQFWGCNEGFVDE